MAANWWGISAQIVAWLGVAVVALAIVGPWIKQRIKRRRRCPKCWYDMSHAPPPGMTCSECGYIAKRERKLFKARRRWRFAFIGVFMLLGAYALNVTPAVKDRGWVAAVPMTALLFGAEHRMMSAIEAHASGNWASSCHDRLWSLNDHFAELRARIHEKRIFRRQAHRLAGDCLDVLDEGRERMADPDWPRRMLDSLWGTGFLTSEHFQRIAKLDDVYVHVPERWPADQPLLIRADWNRGMPWQLRIDTRCRLSASWPATPEYERVTPRFLRGAGWERMPWGDGLLEIGVPPEQGSVVLEVDAALDMKPDPPRFQVLGGGALFVSAMAQSRTWEQMRVLRFKRNVEVSGTAQDYRTGVSLLDVDQALQQLQPTLCRACGADVRRVAIRPAMDDVWATADELSFRRTDENECVLMVDVPMSDRSIRMLMWRLPDLTLAVRLEVLQNGELFGTGFAWWRHNPSLDHFSWDPTGTAVEVTPIDPTASFDAEAKWELRLTGDASIAMRDLDSTQYWNGTVTLPLTIWRPSLRRPPW